jgi:hypothetical protein
LSFLSRAAKKAGVSHRKKKWTPAENQGVGTAYFVFPRKANPLPAYLSRLAAIALN